MRFRIHFLNVGNGDCTIIELPDNNIMIVDIRNARANRGDADPDLENPIVYLGKLTSATEIYRYVQSHPDMDHMDGLSDLANRFSIDNFWDTRNTRRKPAEFGHGFREEDWDSYHQLRQGGSVRFRIRSTEAITSAGGGAFPYAVFVVSPSEALVSEGNEQEDWNLLSYVVVLEYEGFKLVLGGDASDAAWEDIYEWAKTSSQAKSLLSKVTVFKASHHGRNSSYCGFEMLELMSPQKIVISKGSVPGEQSAYGKYYNWSGGADNMYLTSNGTIVVDYYDVQNRKYSIHQGSD